MSVQILSQENHTVANYKKQVLQDYIIAYKSRQASLIGRKEVLTGKAKFGIFGDGKEVPQVVMSKFMKKGDFRAGYYRDQTLMFALGLSNVKAFFAQLYADTNLENEPSSAGRSMNGHFSTRLLTENGEWLPQNDRINVAADISPTGAQMPKVLGLAFASKVYRENWNIIGENNFSNQGNEVAWGTIGNASASEGHFWESINAAGVLQVPMLVSIWDDEYGISVHAKHQTTKEDLSAILKGFETDKNGIGFNIFQVNGWDYVELMNTYQKAEEECRKNHRPTIVHVKQLTQPQGHSTSGSHERYKSKDRLAWEQEYDCLNQMRLWIMSNGLLEEEELINAEKAALNEVKNEQNEAWVQFRTVIDEEKIAFSQLIQPLDVDIANDLRSMRDAGRRDIVKKSHEVLRNTQKQSYEYNALKNALSQYKSKYQDVYSSHLYSQSAQAALNITEIKPIFTETSEEINGFEVLNRGFDYHLSNHPNVIAFGEDVGKIGDVNQGFAGMQEKHGTHRVMDTGIRECTIIGQAIGASLRGLRPIAEIQYLDYLLYGLQMMSDDIATAQYRTKGGQKNPVIIRTRGHRLEGIWHSGSPIGMIINSLRGMLVLTPRNMTQALGFYNTVLKSDDPALIIECLNGYRLKERLPDNFTEFTVPVGVPEVLQEGQDVTIVTYGSCVRIAQEAIPMLAAKGVSVELIDVQSLLPFDIHHSIVESLKKTNKVVFLDEDVRGGASAYMMQKVLEEQKGYLYLDAAPKTITSQDHRPAYSTDGDYFSKSNAEQIYDEIMEMMAEYNPELFGTI